MEALFEFEKPILEMEKRLHDLQELSQEQGMDVRSEIVALEKKLDALIEETYSKLSPWQRVQLSRHPNRPYTRDYIEALFPDFRELHGDRNFSDDPAIMGGMATWPPALGGRKGGTKLPVMILGHQKGRTTKQKMLRNFGMAKPEGYRKGIRLMDMANRFRMPIITFIDTPGAYPGIETEERGQAQAIAESMRFMFTLDVPVIVVVIGEGGSGGALALGVGNKVLMQEYSTYSVISPEGCASILWSDSKFAARASEVLKMNPKELKGLGVIDQIISEPKGGAHRSWDQAFINMGKALKDAMDPYMGTTGKSKTVKLKTGATVRKERFTKFRKMGAKALAQAKELGTK